MEESYISAAVSAFLRSGSIPYYKLRVFARPDDKLFAYYSSGFSSRLLFTYDGATMRYLRKHCREFVPVIEQFVAHMGCNIKDYSRLAGVGDDSVRIVSWSWGDKARQLDDAELMNTCLMVEPQGEPEEQDPFHRAYNAMMENPFGSSNVEWRIR